MTNLIARFIREDNGQDLIEYALVGGLVALGAIVGAQAFGGSLKDLYDRLKIKVDAVLPAA